MLQNKLIAHALDWFIAQDPPALDDAMHCQTRDVFSARLEKLLSQSEQRLGQDAYLLVAIVGEIGNNSFDHNLGNWPDVAGIFFMYDVVQKVVVLADRGQGVRHTISRVKPSVKNDEEALRVAFTEVLSGRAPERRGNGLKFVADIIKKQGWSLECYSGNGTISIVEGNMEISSSSMTGRGTVAILRY